MWERDYLSSGTISHVRLTISNHILHLFHCVTDTQQMFEGIIQMSWFVLLLVHPIRVF